MRVVVDVGGSHTRFALADSAQLLKINKVDTATNSSPVTWLAENIKQLIDGDSVDHVVVALPGRIRGKTLWRAGNLKPWRGTNFSALGEALDAKISVVNDADLAGLGEAVHGAGQSSNIMAYFTVSTGIGGARIVNKKIDCATYGLEPSSQLIDWNNSSRLISVESAKIEATHHKPTGQIEDPALRKELVSKIATGFHNCASAWSVDTIVVNGPPIFESDWLWSELSAGLNELFAGLEDLAPRIVTAELKDDAALYGGIALT